jgi:hypothetical protein
MVQALRSRDQSPMPLHFPPRGTFLAISGSRSTPATAGYGVPRGNGAMLARSKAHREQPEHLELPGHKGQRERPAHREQKE